LVIAGLGTAGLYLRGDANPDWLGYETLYGEQGAWLADFGRDPLFIWFMGRAYDLFGRYGYEDFRVAILGCFLIIAALSVCVIPLQRHLSLVLNALAVSIGVGAMFLTKVTVQIREGMALSLIAASILLILRPPKRDLWRSSWPAYGLLVVAALIHAGTAIYWALYSLTYLILCVRRGSVMRSDFRSAGLFFLAVVCAVLTGRYIASSTNSALDALTQFGMADDPAQTEGWWLKYVYWAAYGGVVLTLRRDLVRAERTMSTRSASAWASTVSFILLFLYVLAICLIAMEQPGSVVSVVARMLSTGAGIALWILLLRGWATSSTLIAALFLVVDQVRTIVAALP
jgi:hypothetical protein